MAKSYVVTLNGLDMGHRETLEAAEELARHFSGHSSTASGLAHVFLEEGRVWMSTRASA